ncbi:hypothetical protein GWI33_005896 [Rhynchophorus ferrugineus]|uniref:Ferritin n=1 Tax=Rhynchophorus ferrugineus TaxID=354439 RepID=A0A834MLG1_RHYFE|nr:hypothetical protein GWI33_005896 [Rhynchophorus ferrugineus]
MTKINRLIWSYCDYAGEIPGIMKTFVIFVTLFALAACADECYKDVVAACNPTLSKQLAGIANCNAKYGGIQELQPDLQRFANHLFFRSFDFLLMATHYGNYIKNRPGFEKLFRGLSDSLWSDGIETIKYITTRGGQMNLNNIAKDLQDEELTSPSLELYEMQSIAKALDVEKKLALQAFDLHKSASGKKHESHDPEIAHHLEEEFMEKHRDTIRELAGHSRDLSVLLSGPDASLALYLFDQHLQK